MLAWWALAALADDRPNLVLITLDTTRADVLSCYGVPAGPYRVKTLTTPNLDALAREGIRFEQFFAHAPSTLSSHASLLTGLDPHGHSVARNGFPLDASVPTLARRLSLAGWDTVAVVGSAALEASMGLDQGFRLYDDQVTDLSGAMYQARADNVVTRTLAAVDARPDKDAPLFLFAHFYDPHAPYDPPEPFRTAFTDPAYQGNIDPNDPLVFRQFATNVRNRAADPADISHVADLYRAEVAFVDAQVGVLLAGLGERGLLEHALVVVVADHGETLADDPIYAWSHGSNIGYEVMHIPLLMQGYGMPLAEHAVIARQAAMDGLSSTLLELLGQSGPPLGEGISFASWLRAGPSLDEEGWPERPTIPAYLEATRPRFAESATEWNNLFMHRGVFASGWGVVSAPFLQETQRFYDESPSPNEEMRALLDQMMRQWDLSAPAHAELAPAPETHDALKALGYVE